MKPTRSEPSFISKQVLHGSYLFADLAPAPGAELAIVCAGREECAADYRIERAGFRYHALEYVVHGQWELTVRGESHELGPGSVFSYSPSTRYALRATGSGQLVKFFVDFTGRRASRLLKAAGLVGGRPANVGQSRWLHDLFDQILEGANLSRQSASRLGTLLTEVMLLRVREDLRTGAAVLSDSHRSYLRCRRHVQEHYLKLRSVDEVASACNLNAAYLSRLFRRFAGEGPLQYLTRLKMDYAAELIVRQGYAVKQAASAVGFEDPYHFSRVFKRIHGTAPGHFVRG